MILEGVPTKCAAVPSFCHIGVSCKHGVQIKNRCPVVSQPLPGKGAAQSGFPMTAVACNSTFIGSQSFFPSRTPRQLLAFTKSSFRIGCHLDQSFPGESLGDSTRTPRRRNPGHVACFRLVAAAGRHEVGQGRPCSEYNDPRQKCEGVHRSAPHVPISPFPQPGGFRRFGCSYPCLRAKNSSSSSCGSALMATRLRDDGDMPNSTSSSFICFMAAFATTR